MSDAKTETAQVVEFLKQWKISNMDKPGALLPKAKFDGPADRSYYLKNKEVRKYLQHEKQTFGINLGWTDDAEPATAAKVSRWFFTPVAGDDRKPLTYGEKVAVGNGRSPSLVRYKERDVGINLDWSESPEFEWRLLGGTVGKPVEPADFLAIYNERNDDCLIFFDRTAGADIGWPSSKTMLDQLEGALREAVRNRARKAMDDLLGREPRS